MLISCTKILIWGEDFLECVKGFFIILFLKSWNICNVSIFPFAAFLSSLTSVCLLSWPFGHIFLNHGIFEKGSVCMMSICAHDVYICRLYFAFAALRGHMKSVSISCNRQWFAIMSSESLFQFVIYVTICHIYVISQIYIWYIIIILWWLVMMLEKL